jgi:hypothetical protein
MLKQAVRKVGRLAKKWLNEDEPSGPPPREFSYAWLNRVLFPQILTDAGKLRSHYTWGVLQSANLAKALAINRISVFEFGVAGGNGLIALEKAAERIEGHYDVAIDVYGFDTGEGLPKPRDYRDLPNIYTEGRHPMDVDKLRKRLHRAKLILGNVESTVKDFMRSRPAPVAFLAIDVDFYSSTMAALQLLEAEQELLLPRIHCYLDDIMGLTFGDHNGERLAIADFNASHSARKISQIYGLKYFLPPPYATEPWTEQFFLAHILDHGLYGKFDGIAPLYDLSLRTDS